MLIIAQSAGGAAAFAESSPWQVPTADVRFTVEVTKRPADPAAGVVVLLPDGGLLPRPAPQPIVVDADGRELRSECLWFNPHEGLAVVFEPPAKGDLVNVYLRGVPQISSPPPASPLRPSLLLYTQMGAASLEDARRLAAETPPGRSARCGVVENIAETENPYGFDENYISYYSGWLKAPVTGRYYLATISSDGSECRVDGKVVAAWPGVHDRQAGAKGQFGGHIDLTQGKHRVEYFHFKTKGRAEAQLVWRTPNDKPDALPHTVAPGDFLASGTARLKAGQTRGGAPLAAFTFECASYLWLGDRPVNYYSFRALPLDGGAPDTGYTWDFGDGRRVSARECTWLFDGNDIRDMTLVTTNKLGATRSTRPVYFDHMPGGSTINAFGQRKLYRAALLTMCRAAGEKQRPCAGWSPDLWATLLGVIEPFEGLDLLREVVERSRPDVLALKPEARRQLEDVFFDLLRRADPKEALQWVDRFEKEESDAARKFHWQMQRVEVVLYDRNDWQEAKRLVESLDKEATAAGPEAATRLLVRYGDIAWLQGKTTDAQRLYTQAQDKYQKAKPDWRAEAVRQTSYYEMASSQISQGYYYEARQILDRWEIEFPLSKLAGDFPIAAAEYDIATDNRARAARILAAYRAGAELAPFLPQAMKLEWECLASLGRDDQRRDLARDITKRFPTLPLADDARRWLAEKGEK